MNKPIHKRRLERLDKNSVSQSEIEEVHDKLRDEHEDRAFEVIKREDPKFITFYRMLRKEDTRPGMQI